MQHRADDGPALLHHKGLLHARPQVAERDLLVQLEDALLHLRDHVGLVAAVAGLVELVGVQQRLEGRHEHSARVPNVRPHAARVDLVRPRQVRPVDALDARGGLVPLALAQHLLHALSAARRRLQIGLQPRVLLLPQLLLERVAGGQNIGRRKHVPRRLVLAHHFAAPHDLVKPRADVVHDDFHVLGCHGAVVDVVVELRERDGPQLMRRGDETLLRGPNAPARALLAEVGPDELVPERQHRVDRGPHRVVDEGVRARDQRLPLLLHLRQGRHGEAQLRGVRAGQRPGRRVAHVREEVFHAAAPAAAAPAAADDDSFRQGGKGLVRHCAERRRHLPVALLDEFAHPSTNDHVFCALHAAGVLQPRVHLFGARRQAPDRLAVQLLLRPHRRLERFSQIEKRELHFLSGVQPREQRGQRRVEIVLPVVAAEARVEAGRVAAAAAAGGRRFERAVPIHRLLLLLALLLALPLLRRLRGVEIAAARRPHALLPRPLCLCRGLHAVVHAQQFSCPVLNPVKDFQRRTPDARDEPRETNGV